MAAIFREKQRKNTKNSRILAKKKKQFQAQMLFFMPFIWIFIYLKQTCFSKISKKQDGRHISVQNCKYKGKCYKK